MNKISKYIKSWIRIILIKLKYGRKIKFCFSNIKSLYIGKGVEIIISGEGKIEFGEGTYIDDYCKFECSDGYIVIGKNNYFNCYCKLISLKKIITGDDCIFGPNTNIYDHDHRFSIKTELIRKQGFCYDEVLIKDNIWIGANCVITKGVTISNRIVVAANSTVTKDLILSGVYAGVPVKIIKKI